MHREDRDKLLLDRGIQPVLASSTLPVPAEETKPEGWALKVTKKATRFNEKQKKYIEEKFFLFQKTGHKVEAVTVAQESFCRLVIFLVVVVGGGGGEHSVRSSNLLISIVS